MPKMMRNQYCQRSRGKERMRARRRSKTRKLVAGATDVEVHVIGMSCEEEGVQLSRMED
jgi:hypothetical protein